MGLLDEAFKLCSHLKINVFTITFLLLIERCSLLGLTIPIVLGGVGARLLLSVALIVKPLEFRVLVLALFDHLVPVF